MRRVSTVYMQCATLVWTIWVNLGSGSLYVEVEGQRGGPLLLLLLLLPLLECHHANGSWDHVSNQVRGSFPSPASSPTLTTPTTSGWLRFFDVVEWNLVRIWCCSPTIPPHPTRPWFMDIHSPPLTRKLSSALCFIGSRSLRHRYALPRG
ncbi:hypothetical protein BDP55DRAFT_10032 [Colletotrichum godetiae]|uniref:Uncharacterized protein n=1 Tax=Colletotrichum godetiae TaxID=1209918 RepID=A0AAJ0EZC4_9PEZI|nr:uncharacterized protein BDP55DRAFT_10032 [Colletotrichum godetiae]KAK1701099.1 hypothetical protein BDP55DRAFT_10032 [Colletotrichum godetiae]